MYLSFGTVAAIFVGGLIRGLVDMMAARRGLNDNQKARVENRGTLLASGLIAGEALMGLVFSALAFFDVQVPNVWPGTTYILSVLVMVALGYILIKLPLNNAGKPDEPAAPINI